MSLNDFAYFQISTKALLKRDKEILLLITNDGYYDFPGGRMDKSEIDFDLEKILIRELQEELGKNLKFKINDIVFAAKRHYDKNNLDHHVLALFFEVNYLAGNILLSDEHVKSQWIDPKSILKYPQKFISQDEYNQFKKYCHQTNL